MQQQISATQSVVFPSKVLQGERAVLPVAAVLVMLIACRTRTQVIAELLLIALERIAVMRGACVR